MTSNQAKPLKSVWAKAGEELGNFLTEGKAEREIPKAALSMASLDALKRACECRLALRLGRRPTFEEWIEEPLVSMTELDSFMTPEERGRLDSEILAHEQGRPCPPAPETTWDGYEIETCNQIGQLLGCQPPPPKLIGDATNPFTEC